LAVISHLGCLWGLGRPWRHELVGHLWTSFVVFGVLGSVGRRRVWRLERRRFRASWAASVLGVFGVLGVLGGVGLRRLWRRRSWASLTSWVAQFLGVLGDLGASVLGVFGVVVLGGVSLGRLGQHMSCASWGRRSWASCSSLAFLVLGVFGLGCIWRLWVSLASCGASVLGVLGAVDLGGLCRLGRRQSCSSLES
jgi:hypothetical protein